MNDVVENRYSKQLSRFRQLFGNGVVFSAWRWVARGMIVTQHDRT